MAEADVFGILFLGYLSMVKGCPLINIIPSSLNVPVDLLGVKYCSKQLAQGVNNDATFTLGAFKPYLEQYYDKKSRTDMVFFDIASNVQKAGQIIASYYPRITLLHSSDIIISFFLQYCKIPSYQGETTLLI